MKVERLLSYFFPRFTGNILSLRVAGILILSVLFASIVGYIVIEEYTLVEALYMTIITFSTVGYAEVRPLSPNGQTFATLIIIINIGVFAYSISVFTYYITEGEIFNKIHHYYIRKKVESMENHAIICGFGKYGREIYRNLNTQRLKVVVIDFNDEVIQQLQEEGEEINYVLGDSTHDDILLKAGIEKASSLISALEDDSDNLLTVMSARQLNPKLNIISRASSPRVEGKLAKAGADHALVPERLGGFYMASLLNKPNAVEFFTFLTREFEEDLGFEEVNCNDLSEELIGKSIREVNLRMKYGINIIGLRDLNNEFLVNPSPDYVLTTGTKLIVLGNNAQIKSIRDHIEELK